MEYMIEVVGLEIGITCKKIFAGYSENYYPLPIFIIRHRPAPIFEPAPLFEVLGYYIFDSSKLHIILFQSNNFRRRHFLTHSHHSFDSFLIMITRELILFTLLLL